jgi:hypothetical protein
MARQEALAARMKARMAKMDKVGLLRLLDEEAAHTAQFAIDSAFMELKSETEMIREFQESERKFELEMAQKRAEFENEQNTKDNETHLKEQLKTLMDQVG